MKDKRHIGFDDCMYAIGRVFRGEEPDIENAGTFSDENNMLIVWRRKPGHLFREVSNDKFIDVGSFPPFTKDEYRKDFMFRVENNAVKEILL